MFSIEEIKEAASKASGLSDFGDGGFEEPLAVLLNAYARDTRLSPLGEQAVRRDLVGDLVGRLRVVDGLKAAPDALRAGIEKPIFILGFPRTGTTALHNVIQADADCQVLENWLGILPKSRPPRASWQSDPEYLSIAEGLRQLYAINPDLRAQHDISADSADECRFLFKHLFMDDGYGYLCDLPGYWEWFDAQSMVPAYAWHKKVLKLIQFPRDTKRRWVLKYPSHIAWIKDLLEVYPDACIIQTHRDPAATIPSFASLISGAAQFFSGGRPPERLGPFLASQWRDRIGNFMETRAALGKESQFFDLQFTDVVKDPVGSLERAFAHFGLALSADSERRMREWASRHPPGRHGHHAYSAEDFGLDFAELSENFRDYRERFGVAAERR